MGCQKKIAEKIVEKKADYVLALKGNQDQFHEDIKLYLDTEYEKPHSQIEDNIYETIEKDHGRIETRRFWITEKIDWLDDKNNWKVLV